MVVQISCSKEFCPCPGASHAIGKITCGRKPVEPVVTGFYPDHPLDQDRLERSQRRFLLEHIRQPSRPWQEPVQSLGISELTASSPSLANSTYPAKTRMNASGMKVATLPSLS